MELEFWEQDPTYQEKLLLSQSLQPYKIDWKVKGEEKLWIH